MKTKLFSFNTGRQYSTHGQLIGCHATMTGSDELGDWWDIVFNDTARGITGLITGVSMADEASVMQAYDAGRHSYISNNDPRLAAIGLHLRGELENGGAS
jgi:hypothetical protein